MCAHALHMSVSEDAVPKRPWSECCDNGKSYAGWALILNPKPVIKTYDWDRAVS